MKKMCITKLIKHKTCLSNYVLELVLVMESIISLYLFNDYITHPIPIVILLLFALYIGVLVRLYLLLKGKRIDKTRIKKCIKPLVIFVKSYVLIIAAVICLVMPPVVIHKRVMKAEAEKDNFQVFYGNESYEIDSYYGDYSLPTNMTYLRYVLSNEEYQLLQYDEKLQVIKSILQWEAKRLGVPYFDFKCEDLPDDVAGQYCCVPVNTITINKKCIDKGYHIENVCICCIHEVRHLYQASLCELWLDLTPEQRALKIFEGENIDSYLANFRDYKRMDDDFYEYNTQYVEWDADSYAKKELEELIQTVTINYYLSD